MRINIIVIMLLFVIAILVTIIAYLSGKNSKSRSSSDKFKLIDRVWLFFGSARRTSRKYDNSTNITQLKSNVEQYSKTISSSTINNIYDTFGLSYLKLEIWAKTINKNNFTLNDLESSLNHIKFRNLKSRIDLNMARSISPLTAISNKAIDYMQSKYSEPELENFKLSDDRIFSLDTKINAILKRDLGEVYEEISEIALIENTLIQMLPTVSNNIQDGGIDIELIATVLGGVAFALRKPEVGIPGFIAMLANKLKKRKRTNSYMKVFYQKYCEYFFKINRFAELYRASLQRQIDHLSKQLQFTLVDPILLAVEHLDRKGVQLQLSSNELLKTMGLEPTLDGRGLPLHLNEPGKFITGERS